jgi:predicted PhzF superfamily epimerase YddE/YHI9
LLVYVEEQIFHTRNPFAYGGVYEDPATGAASAAFAGYLQDINWPHGGSIDLIQRGRYGNALPDPCRNSR